MEKESVPSLQEKRRKYYLDAVSFTIEAKASCDLIKVHWA